MGGGGLVSFWGPAMDFDERGSALMGDGFEEGR